MRNDRSSTGIGSGGDVASPGNHGGWSAWRMGVGHSAGILRRAGTDSDRPPLSHVPPPLRGETRSTVRPGEPGFLIRARLEEHGDDR